MVVGWRLDVEVVVGGVMVGLVVGVVVVVGVVLWLFRLIGTLAVLGVWRLFGDAVRLVVGDCERRDDDGDRFLGVDCCCGSNCGMGDEAPVIWTRTKSEKSLLLLLLRDSRLELMIVEDGVVF